MKYLLLLFFFGQVAMLFAQTDTSYQNLYKPNLEELEREQKKDNSEASVSVAGFTTTTLRESAGIVTLITADEIQKMGARDVTDVIRTVQGFEVTLDVIPVLVVRGNGANEGKILFLIDGQVINDISLGYCMIFQRFPVYNIERIEIIRGAGSAIYGGQAGLAVINIITKKVANNQEVGFSTTMGATGNAWSRGVLEGYALTKLKNGLLIDLSASYNYGKQTDRNYTGGIYNTYVDNATSSALTSNNFNIGLRYKQFSLRFVQNKYFIVNPHFGNSKINISGNFLTMGYVFNMTPQLSLHTKASFKQQVPYYFSDIPDLPASLGATGKLRSLEAANMLENRVLGNFYALYKPWESLTISAGVEAFHDKSSYFATTYTFRDSSRVAQFNNIGAFAEVNLRSKIANVTLGARVDKYGSVLPVVVPRIAITRAFEKLHFKALYTEAFKSPSIHNIRFASIGSSILPERFRLIEFETGLKIGDKLQLNANLYDIVIQNAITRRDLGTTNFEFINTGDIGTQGIEGEARYRTEKMDIQFGYSFYRVSKNSKEREIPTLPTVFSGVPAQKATLRISRELTENLSANVTFMYLTNKFRVSDLRPGFIEQYSNEQHLNINFQYKNFILKNLTFMFGCYNALDQKQYFLSWKRDFSAEVYLPSQGREFLVKLMYNIKN